LLFVIVQLVDDSGTTAPLGRARRDMSSRSERPRAARL